MLQVSAGAGASLLLPSCGAAPDEAAFVGQPHVDGLLLLPPTAAEAATKAAAAADDPGPYVDQIGRGFDSVFDEDRRYFVEGEQVATRYTPDPAYMPNTLKYELVENQSQYRSVISRSAKAKGRYGLFKGRAGGSSQTEKVNNSYSLRVCAIAKKFGPALILKNGTVNVRDEAKRVIRAARNNKDALLLGMGDTYISGIMPASELLIDIVFETSSAAARRALKASISASYGALASGSGSYSQLIGSAREHRKITVELSGINSVSREFTPGDAWSIIENFFNDSTTQAYAPLMFRRDVSELVLNDRSLDWVDVRARARREAFVSEAEACLLYLANGRADAEYVAAHPEEFAVDVHARAQEDLEAIRTAERRVNQIGAEARLDFDESGATTAKFDTARFDGILPGLKTYSQKEPTPAPAPAPRPKPLREPRERREPPGSSF